MNNAKRVLALAGALLVLVFSFSGCMQTESNVAFHWNGAIDYTVNYQVSPQIFSGEEGSDADVSERTKSYFDNIKAEIEKCTQAEFRDTSTDEYAGMEFTTSFKNVAAWTESGIEEVLAETIPAPTVGTGEAVSIHLYAGNHIFYNTYQLLGNIPADILGINSQIPAESGSDQPIYNITFSATAPFKLGTVSNAPEVTGNTYKWTSDSNSEVVPVEFTVNVPSLLTLILVAVLLLAIIIVIIVLIVKSTKKKPADDESVTGAMESAEEAFFGSEGDEQASDASADNELPADEAPEVEAEAASDAEIPEDQVSEADEEEQLETPDEDESF